MSDVTRILSQLEAGDSQAAERLLPLIYDELRKLATARMALENPGHTLQATALVHEAYVRLTDNQQEHGWNGRGHFFAVASEAMRRILVDRARAKKQLKRGRGWQRIELQEVDVADGSKPELVLAIHEALEDLASEDRDLAELVKLRVFAGMSLPEAAKVLGLPKSTAYVRWAYAKSRLRCLLADNSS